MSILISIPASTATPPTTVRVVSQTDGESLRIVHAQDAIEARRIAGEWARRFYSTKTAGRVLTFEGQE